MSTIIHANIHLGSDVAVTAETVNGFVWLRLGDSVVIHIADENALGELAGAIDMASKYLSIV